ncbi:MAG: YrhB family protein [Polyangiaceae bacterium]|nr:YrhB family protein [Polyangiaceae bacterium]
MSCEQARTAVLKRIHEEGFKDDEVAILDSETIEKPYGWIFFFNSRRYVETGNMMHSFFGYGPVVVIAKTGEIIMLTSRAPTEGYIKELEDERHLPH